MAVTVIKMMETRESVRGLLEERLKLMDELFLDMLKDEEDELQKEVRSALTSGGKRIRPTLVFLASCFGETEADDIVPLMAMIELMHSGSLVHDDVVDHAETRRGRPTINAEKGNHAAVQSGDYALSKSMGLLKRYKGTGIGETLAETSMEMCLGELQQLRGEYSFSIQSMEDYLARIKRKTAYLMASSCYTGAIAAKLPEPWREALRSFGFSFGMAFQIRDDVLDYEGADREGKPVYQDMNRGIFTLPLMFSMETGFDRSVSALLLKREKSESECRTIVEWVRRSGGIERTKELASEYVDKAVRAVSILPDCGAKELLIEMANKYS